MKIELKNLKIATSLSEETTAYTADVMVDGVRAFAASNSGHGGCDLFRQLGTVSEADVNAWLADHVAPNGPWQADPAQRAAYDTGTPCTLEVFVGREVARRESDREWARVTKKVALLVDGEIRTYPLKTMPPTPANLTKIATAIASGQVKGELINEANDDVTRRAKLAFGLTDSDPEEAVMERLREGRLTPADARFLIAQDKRAAKPDSDLQAMLVRVAEEGEAHHAAYVAERDAKNAAERAAREAALPPRFVMSDVEGRPAKRITDSATGKALEVGLCDLAGARMALAAFA